MSSIFVLGAGMVGVSTALALQADGHEVVLVDRGDAGRETSYGNAGIIQAEAVEPFAMPRDLISLARIALRRSNDVNYHLAALPGQARALWAYFQASRPDRHRAIAADYAPMIRRSTADHQVLIEASGAEHLIRRNGFYQVYRSAAQLDAAARDAARINETYGVGVETLDAAQLQRREPALRPGLAGALRWTDPWTCRDPGGLVAAYALLFQKRGGRFENGDAATLKSANSYSDAGDARTLTSANAYTDSVFQAFNDDFDALRSDVDHRFHVQDRRIDRMAAMSGAYAGMAMNTAGLSGRNRIGVGVGAQGGEAALAIGYQRAIGTRAAVSLGGAIGGGEKSVMGGAGFSW